MKQLLIKVKDYFTANTCRKIFFFSGLLTLLLLISAAVTGVAAFNYFLLLASLVCAGATLVDSMGARVTFLKTIKEMQYEHLREIADKQAAGHEVNVTPTFNDTEKKYLRHRKNTFVLVILLKLGILIAIFSLLFAI